MAAPRSCSSISSQFVQFSHEKMMLPSFPVLKQAHLSSEILASPNPNSLKQRSNQKDRESEWFALFFCFGSHLVPWSSLSETIFDCSSGNKEMRGLAGGLLAVWTISVASPVIAAAQGCKLPGSEVQGLVWKS